MSSKQFNSTRIAFGSCLFPGMDPELRIFEHVVSRNPSLWIWGGDNTYLDYQAWSMKDQFLLWRDVLGKDPYISAPPSEYEQIWNLTFNASIHYQQLSAQCPIIGILDDHDYGQNNCGIDNPNKDFAKSAFLNFLNVSKDDIRRKRGGLYLHYPLTVSLNEHISKKIDIILLDVRYFAFKNETVDDILGAAQWKWFEDVLKNELQHELVLIVSGIQVLPSKRSLFGEQWFGKYPQSHLKMMKLLLPLLQSPDQRLLFISGDAHFGELSHVNCINSEKEHFAMNEILSSGLTHTDFETNFAISQLYKIFYFFDYEQVSDCVEWGANFGEIEIEWKQNENADLDRVWMNIFDKNGDISCRHQYFPKAAQLNRSLDEILMILQKNEDKILYTIDDFMCFSERYLDVVPLEEQTGRILMLLIGCTIAYFPLLLLFSSVMCFVCRIRRRRKDKAD